MNFGFILVLERSERFVSLISQSICSGVSASFSSVSIDVLFFIGCSELFVVICFCSVVAAAEMSSEFVINLHFPFTNCLAGLILSLLGLTVTFDGCLADAATVAVLPLGLAAELILFEVTLFTDLSLEPVGVMFAVGFSLLLAEFAGRFLKVTEVAPRRTVAASVELLRLICFLVGFAQLFGLLPEFAFADAELEEEELSLPFEVAPTAFCLLLVAEFNRLLKVDVVVLLLPEAARPMDLCLPVRFSGLGLFFKFWLLVKLGRLAGLLQVGLTPGLVVLILTSAAVSLPPSTADLARWPRCSADLSALGCFSPPAGGTRLRPLVAAVVAVVPVVTLYCFRVEVGSFSFDELRNFDETLFTADLITSTAATPDEEEEDDEMIIFLARDFFTTSSASSVASSTIEGIFAGSREHVSSSSSSSEIHDTDGLSSVGASSTSTSVEPSTTLSTALSLQLLSGTLEASDSMIKSSHSRALLCSYSSDGLPGSYKLA